MSVDTQRLYDWKAKKFAGGQDSEDWNEAFFYALERVVDTLNSSDVGLSDVDAPDSREEDIDVDAQYFGPIADMLDYFLQETGQWGSEDPDRLAVKFRRAVGKAHNITMQEEDPYARLGTPDDDDDDDEETLD